MPNLSYKSSHHYATGIALMVIGLGGVAGSITGSLAAMLAALFCDPDTTLYNVGTATSSPTDANPFAASNFLFSGANFVKGLWSHL